MTAEMSAWIWPAGEPDRRDKWSREKAVLFASTASAILWLLLIAIVKG